MMTRSASRTTEGMSQVMSSVAFIRLACCCWAISTSKPTTCNLSLPARLSRAAQSRRPSPIEVPMRPRPIIATFSMAVGSFLDAWAGGPGAAPHNLMTHIVKYSIAARTERVPGQLTLPGHDRLSMDDVVRAYAIRPDDGVVLRLPPA